MIAVYFQIIKEKPRFVDVTIIAIKSIEAGIALLLSNEERIYKFYAQQLKTHLQLDTITEDTLAEKLYLHITGHLEGEYITIVCIPIYKIQ